MLGGRHIPDKASCIQLSNFRPQYWRISKPVTGTAQWFRHNDTYRGWLASSSSEKQVLILSGRIGFGKTIMLANIIADVTASLNGSKLA